MIRKYGAINEEVNRIKSLFGESRLYGNLVEQEVSTGCIKGDCENGQGTYTWVSSKYVGEFKNSEKNGQGTYTWLSGNKYVGEWKDGERNGQGTWSNARVGMEYVGEWKDDEKNGQGTFTWTHVDYGMEYVGEYKDGKKNGQGTFTSANGDKYVGEWKDGERNGQGTKTLADGTIEYKGLWIDDEKNGQGTFHEPISNNTEEKTVTPKDDTQKGEDRTDDIPKMREGYKNEEDIIYTSPKMNKNYNVGEFVYDKSKDEFKIKSKYPFFGKRTGNLVKQTEDSFWKTLSKWYDKPLNSGNTTLDIINNKKFKVTIK